MQPVYDDQTDAAPRAPERVYLALPDEACQLEEAAPRWRTDRSRSSDVEYLRADLAMAVRAEGHATEDGVQPGGRGPVVPPASTGQGAPAASPGDALVARWCAAWGDDAPSRATQRAMVDDIDRAVTLAVALETRASAGRRGAGARAVRSSEQLPLALGAAPAEGGPANDPHSQVPPGGTAPAGTEPPPVVVRPAPARTESSAGGADPGADDWTRYDAYLVRLWSSAKVGSLAPLAAEPSGLAVVLLPEPGNEVDAEAVALGVERTEDEVGGLAVEGWPQLRAVAYVARAEVRKPALFAGLLSGRGPAHGRLHLEPDGWYLHLPRRGGVAGAG